MNRKFMQTLDDPHYRKLEQIARERGTTVQQLLRIIVVPEWQEQWKRKARKRRLKKWRSEKAA